MARFSGKLSAGLPKVAARLVDEVICGVQSRGPVRLSEIGRALDLPVAIKKVIERLGRQLQPQGINGQGAAEPAGALEPSTSVIRMRDDRHVVIGRGRELKEVREVAAGCRRRFRTTVLKEEAKNEKVFPLGFGGCGVRFHGHEKKFFLVVIDGFGNERRTSPASTSGAGRS